MSIDSMRNAERETAAVATSTASETSPRMSRSRATLDRLARRLADRLILGPTRHEITASGRSAIRIPYGDGHLELWTQGKGGGGNGECWTQCRTPDMRPLTD